MLRLRSWASSMISTLYLHSRKSSWSSRSRMPSVMNLTAVAALRWRSYRTCRQEGPDQDSGSLDACAAVALKSQSCTQHSVRGTCSHGDAATAGITAGGGQAAFSRGRAAPHEEICLPSAQIFSSYRGQPAVRWEQCLSSLSAICPKLVGCTIPGSQQHPPDRWQAHPPLLWQC